MAFGFNSARSNAKQTMDKDGFGSSKRTSSGLPMQTGYPSHQGYNPIEQASDWQFPFTPPTRQPTVDPSTGMLYDQFQLDVTGARPESPWLKQQLAKQDLLMGQRRDQATSAALGARDTGFNQLASSGGLSSGARERLNQTAQRGISNAQATLSAQDSLNRLGLRTQDFTNQVNADKWNIGNNFGQIDSQANFDTGLFDIAATAWGADQIAKGYGGGGGGGGKKLTPGQPGTIDRPKMGTGPGSHNSVSHTPGGGTNSAWDRLTGGNPFKKGIREGITTIVGG